MKALRSYRKILIMRKVGSTLKDSVWQLVLDTLVEWGRYNKCTINKSVFTIELENGSILLFKGMDDSEKIKSITGITDIWCEEATEFNEEDIEQLNLRLRAKADGLQMIFSFNPVSKANLVFKRWFRKGAVIADDTVIHQSTYKDNKFLPQEYIDNLQEMERTNPVYYRIYALGEFCSLDKLVYTNWGIGMPPESLEGLKPAIGLDFGFVNDLTAFTVSLLDEQDKKIYITCREAREREKRRTWVVWLRYYTFSQDLCYQPYSKCCTAKAHASVEVWTGSHLLSNSSR
jgi:phage terminase large subunit